MVLPMVQSQTDKNVYSRIKGIVEKGLEHLYITLSSSHFFNKIAFEQYFFKWLKTENTYYISNRLISNGRETFYYQAIDLIVVLHK